MKFKDEKGATGIDISIAIFVITIFVALLSVISYNVNSKSTDMEKKAQCINYAINEIEKVKNAGIESFVGMTTDPNNSVPIQIDGNEFKEGYIDNSPYYKKVYVIDYVDTSGNEGKIRELVKKVTVEISYKDKNNVEKIELSTIISKE